MITIPSVEKLTEWVNTARTIWTEELQRPIPDDQLASWIAAFSVGKTGEDMRAALQASAEDIERHKVPPKPEHVDPSLVSLASLARIRGSMWTARSNVPYGPRPNQDSNILSTTAFHLYTSAQQQQMIRDLKSRGYTHCDRGPWVPDGDQGYHEHYPPKPIAWEAELDILEMLWDAGLAPVVFVKPDNWTAEQLETLTPYYSQPRAQRLVRIAGPGGWEPSKDTPNAEWVRWAKWGARVLPNALRFIHMCPDFDAPGNNDDFTEGQPAFIGMPEAWKRVAPYLHGYLMQNGGYSMSDNVVPTEQFKKDFAALFNKDGGRESIASRFAHGVGGWPTFSAWGNRGMMLWAGEYAAFINYWLDAPERYALDLGDLAMRSGADGYLDGGRVDVP